VTSFLVLVVKVGRVVVRGSEGQSHQIHQRREDVQELHGVGVVAAGEGRAGVVDQQGDAGGFFE